MPTPLLVTLIVIWQSSLIIFVLSSIVEVMGRDGLIHKFLVSDTKESVVSDKLSTTLCLIQNSLESVWVNLLIIRKSIAFFYIKKCIKLI